jgi:tRNA pseudouridine38-40 synthase
MSRYFVEVSYKGTNYAGFQVQQNANTIQAEVEKALKIYFKRDFELTGSSRTDAGVHALQNFFHFDMDETYQLSETTDVVYHLNAILPGDIVMKGITRVEDQAHCRFDALYRKYEYTIYNSKDPFLEDRAYYYPYPLDLNLLNEAAAVILMNTDFQSFSKKNTQVYTYECNIMESAWESHNHKLIYRVRGSRFLRGMVRGLVGTMLRVGTGKIGVVEFKEIINAHDISRVDFSMPSHGLVLINVGY